MASPPFQYVPPTNDAISKAVATPYRNHTAPRTPTTNAPTDPISTRLPPLAGIDASGGGTPPPGALVGPSTGGGTVAVVAGKVPFE